MNVRVEHTAGCGDEEQVDRCDDADSDNRGEILTALPSFLLGYFVCHENSFCSD